MTSSPCPPVLCRSTEAPPRPPGLSDALPIGATEAPGLAPWAAAGALRCARHPAAHLGRARAAMELPGAGQPTDRTCEGALDAAARTRLHEALGDGGGGQGVSMIGPVLKRLWRHRLVAAGSRLVVDAHRVTDASPCSPADSCVLARVSARVSVGNTPGITMWPV